MASITMLVESQMTDVPTGGVDTGEAALGSQNLALAATGGIVTLAVLCVLASLPLRRRASRHD